MSVFIYKTLHHLRSAVTTSHTCGVYFLRIRPYSTSLQSIENTPNQPFTTTYLVNSCGFPLEKALSASRYVRLKASDQPDSVLDFLDTYGFTKSQISRIVRVFPPVLLCGTEKTLLPKLEFFKAKGMSTADVTRMLSVAPNAFKRSLGNQIIPCFEFFSNLIRSEEKTIDVFKRCPKLLLCDPETHLTPKLEILQETGVPDRHIVYLVVAQPRALRTGNQIFREVVEDVKKMGFNPLSKNFVIAVHVLRSMSKSTWERKLGVYKKWGWSEEDALLAFRRHPWCMTTSEDKIMRTMDYVVNKMGLNSSCLLRRPKVMSFNLEKTVIPRCMVYQILSSKGLIKDSNARLLEMLECTKEKFLKLLNSHGLLKLYEEKLALAQ